VRNGVSGLGSKGLFRFHPEFFQQSNSFVQGGRRRSVCNQALCLNPFLRSNSISIDATAAVAGVEMRDERTTHGTPVHYVLLVLQTLFAKGVSAALQDHNTCPSSSPRWQRYTRQTYRANASTGIIPFWIVTRRPGCRSSGRRTGEKSQHPLE